MSETWLALAYLPVVLQMCAVTPGMTWFGWTFVDQPFSGPSRYRGAIIWHLVGLACGCGATAQAAIMAAASSPTVIDPWFDTQVCGVMLMLQVASLVLLLIHRSRARRRYQRRLQPA